MLILATSNCSVGFLQLPVRAVCCV